MGTDTTTGTGTRPDTGTGPDTGTRPGTGTGPGTATDPATGPEARTDRLPAHPPRLHWTRLAPDVYHAMVALDRAARKGVAPVILELAKIRASQINRCAVCLDMHAETALAAGESVQRIVQLSAWAESRHLYTAREIAALELTDAITILPGGFVPDEVYERAAKEFDATELTHLIAGITVMNAWNRFGVTARIGIGYYGRPRASHDH
ncbi:carboxymuconolactone decarboxylase family protein [Streptomyces sp. NPDC055078]